MGLSKRAALFMMMMMMAGFCGLSMADVYKVGDSAGWTILSGGADYRDWAATKQFFAGDTLVFEYNNQYHDVLQVKVEDFKSCNSNSPIARYGKGTDFISLESSGDYYFLCGFPGHCLAGQKLHITVNSDGSPVPSPPSPVLLPPPANTVAPSLFTSKLSYQLALIVAILASFALLV